MRARGTVRKIICGAALAFLSLAAPRARAQSQTAVTATITDPNGIAYAGGTVKAQLVPAGGPAPCVVIGGNCVAIPGTAGPAPLDSTGKFVVNLYPNGSITPSGTSWLFTVCINPGVLPPWGTGQQCFNVTETISGSSQNITADMDAAAPALIVGTNSSGSTSIFNVKNYGTFANVKVSENVGVFTVGYPPCEATPTTACIYTPTAAGLFSQADVGKTIWVNGTGGGANRTPMSQGIITSVFTENDGNTYVATTSTSSGATCSPNAACYAVWGDDDTPAFTAAAAAAASGGTVYIPCGTYMITGPSFYQNGATYSLIGASEQCVTLIPSPNITSSSNIGTVIDFTASGNTLANLTVDGEEGLLPDEPIIQVGESASARSQLVSNIVIIDAATGGAAQFEAGGIYDTFTDVTSRDPNANSSGGMCDFVSPAGDVVINILCSNANAGYDNLEVNGASSPDTGSSILFQGGTIDECGENSGACTQIVNSQHVSFDHTIIWGSNAGGTGALSVDGTSEVNLDNGVWIGPYDGECGDGLTIASGGVVRMSHTTVVGNGATGCGGSNYAIDNGGTLYFSNGNTVTAQSGASQFTGNLPVFSTTQVGSVTAGDLAVWGSGFLGQLVDGGVGVTQTGSVTADHLAVWSASGVIEDGGTPGTAIQANYYTTLSSDTPVTANTLTAILTQSVTMPSSGCPCRADIRYDVISTIDNQTLDAEVSDGTNTFAGSQGSTTSAAPTGQVGTQITNVTYANNAAITFTLNVETSGVSTTVKALSAQLSQPTYLSVSILTSN